MATRPAPAASAAAVAAKRRSAAAPEPSARVLRRFRLVFNAVKTHFRAVENKAGVSGAQLWALHVVREQPGIGVGGLARAMDIHQSTASNLLRSLLEKQLVLADRGGEDRRSVRLQATARGLRVLAKAPGPLSGVLPEALARLDAATLARLDRDLGRLIEQLGVSERGAGIPLGTADS
jgi:DNA-binding MarR family transcriptional regulator